MSITYPGGDLLIIGSGGREHALTWSLSHSSLLPAGATIYVAPGNGGTATMRHPKVHIENIPITKMDDIITFATTKKIGLVVVGPEDPLADGITDKLKSAGIACFGPSAAAARLESSKVFAKEFMSRHHIPTARYQTFTSYDEAKKYLESIDFPVVVKASGLAAGKGVIIPANTAEAITACHSILVDHAFGTAGSEIVIEEYLDGWEASVLAFSDGVTVVPMPAAQDHKRVYEFNKGLNTGGMGAFCPSRRVTAETMSTVVRTILQPAIDGMRAEGTPFVGILFAGLMIGNGRDDMIPRTLEFNVRFGDPETQVVLPLLKTDLLSIMMACVQGRLRDVHVEFAVNKFAATIVAASEGYPNAYPKGRVITGTQVAAELPMTTVFHAGTTLTPEKQLVTSGGRVLAVTGVGNSMSQAIDAAYNGIEKITFQGMFYRKDIGGAYRRPIPSQPLRLGILGSTRGTDMTAIIDAIHSKRLHARIEIVISNVENAGILEKAKNAGLKYEYIPSKGKTREAFDSEVVRVLHQHNVDLVLLIGFMRILSPVIIQRYAWRIINVHPSLLPDFAGGMDLNVHDAVIKAGRKESGCTIHFIDDGPVDHGPHLIQKRVPIETGETADSLKTKVQHAEGLAFIEAIEMFYDHQHLLTTILRHGFPGTKRSLYRMYRKPALSSSQQRSLIEKINHTLHQHGSATRITHIHTEYCFYIDFDDHLTYHELEESQKRTLKWLLGETFEPEYLGTDSFLVPDEKSSTPSSIIEVGPSMSFTSAWSTNAVSICHNCSVAVRRLERYRRYQLISSHTLSEHELDLFTDLVYDRMTEYRVREPLLTFESSIRPQPWFHIPVVEQGISALQHYNKEMGLAFDDWDQQFYYKLYVDTLKRNPTNVELFDISQSNSEHSRHWFFKGDLIIDGQKVPHSLMQLVTDTLTAHPDNSIIAFADNSSVIRGYRIPVLEPETPGISSSLTLQQRYRHLLLTAETHNFPCGVAPYPGAETGTGGRLRDTHATGRGSLVVAGIAAYCVGNLHIPGYELPWEDNSFKYPHNLASPLQIEIQASNGASDYGNKFGEPVICGFTRSYGQRLSHGERREYVKPIMFSAGIGLLDDEHKVKGKPTRDMLVVKLGGPAYRIGIGGSAASSMVQGENKAALDFNAVQRGDAEMEQKMNRVIRACVELGTRNPIISIHDQGAGGNCNVLKEIVDPAGGRINIRAVKSGDATLSVLELWGAEYQESDALLIEPESRNLFTSICERERAPVAYVGVVTGDGHVIVYDEQDGSTPVDMDLKTVLGSMPKKTFKLDHIKHEMKAVTIPSSVTVTDALDRVLRLLSVGSKRFLTTKVDRAVTGLVAQQQCVGPLHIPLADYGVLAASHLTTSGVVSAVGEQPIKGLVNPAAMARLTVGEALTNIVWAKLTDLTHIKCSANWMWAPKLPGEGALMYDAVLAMRDVMCELGVAVDGGKDSLSMAAVCPTETGTEVVKAPGTLVVSLYCSMDDIRVKVTPDIKHPGQSSLIYIDLSGLSSSTSPRLGGSSLAQVYNQLGDITPDMNNITLFKSSFQAIQHLLSTHHITAGHDRSDGGLIVTVLEMAFAGNCGLHLNIHGIANDVLSTLFAEELGLVMEVKNSDLQHVTSYLTQQHVIHHVIGTTTIAKDIHISYNDTVVLSTSMTSLRDIWEETSFQLEKLQANPECVIQEQTGLASRRAPPLTLTYDPTPSSKEIISSTSKPRVAILREEGSNGDREMSAAFYAAGFDVVDVTMSDIVSGSVHIDDGSFRGIAFVGGFSYADVMDSAKGWAGVIRHNTAVWTQFQNFYRRTDTFSLGVCNGCQLMALLGWVPFPGGIDNTEAPPARFIHNASGRFESRYTTVSIDKSPAIMLQGMEGSTLGVWLQHGEGQAYFPKRDVLDRVVRDSLAPIRYVDDDNRPTEAYPFNPNGSPLGIAALTSPDGRHLAMMPHPERCFLPWQNPWLPQEEKWQSLEVSPWMRLFQNARSWCDRTPIITPQQALITAHVRNTLNETHLDLGFRRSGKVRDSYETENEIILITTDRLSAFDRILASIPFKGQVLNLVSAWWFEQTKHIVPNHIISIPHPNVTVAKKCKPFSIEFVCRAYVTGTTGTSLWTHYAKGVRNYCGNVIPDGLVKNQALPHAIITPTTKADDHDVPISPDEIIAQGYMTKEDWEYTSKAALAVFELGMKIARQHGLLLVDTKYEFGKDSAGVITLIDEVHTPDSSRYWIASSYESRLVAGQEPENVDKEFLRLWYIAHCDPYGDATLPDAPVDMIVELSRRYILLYEMITGQTFVYPKDVIPVQQQLTHDLQPLIRAHHAKHPSK